MTFGRGIAGAGPPATARVVRDGELTEIPAVDLVPGDLVMLDAGDAISADCRLIDVHDLLVEMAALTGESRPTPRISDEMPQVQAADARNCVFMGTSVVNGSGRAVVFVTVMARRVAAVTIAANGETLLVRSRTPDYLAEDNLVISLLAKKRFNGPRVIARVNDPASDELFNPSWGRRAGLAGDITGLADQA